MTYGTFADVYDQASHPLASVTWSTGIVAALQELDAHGSRLLDLGCGTGLGAIALRDLQLSHTVGVDRSASMLSHAAGKYDVIELGDIRTLRRFDEPFDFVVSGFDTMNYLTLEEWPRALIGIGASLKIGGRLLFDLSTPYLLQDTWRNLSYIQELGKDQYLNWSHRYERRRNATETRITFSQGGQHLWTEVHAQFAVSTSQVRTFAQEAGFLVEFVRDVRGGPCIPTTCTALYTLARC